MPLDTVTLVIEVSDTTLEIDLGRKLELYAKAGVPEYWVVDVNANRVLMYMTPTDGDYPGQREAPFGEMLIAGTIAGLQVASTGLG